MSGHQPYFGTLPADHIRVRADLAAGSYVRCGDTLYISAPEACLWRENGIVIEGEETGGGSDNRAESARAEVAALAVVTPAPPRTADIALAAQR